MFTLPKVSNDTIHSPTAQRRNKDNEYGSTPTMCCP
jgi:hypothetical protein